MSGFIQKMGKRNASTAAAKRSKRAKQHTDAASTRKESDTLTANAIETESDTANETKRRQMVAFLRGVNVGGRVHSMAAIVKAMHNAGFENVSTFLASGNILLDVSNASQTQEDVETQVEDVLSKLFGVTLPVFVRSREEIEVILNNVDKTTTAMNVVMIKQGLTQQHRSTLAELCTDDDELLALQREFLWYSATKMSESPLFKVSFEKKLGVAVTVRNVNTLRRILVRLDT